MVPLQSTLREFGATVKWDDYSNLFTIAKDGVYLKVKPNSKVAMLNGKPMALTVPVVFKGKTAFMSKDFINQVFQSGLDKTFVVETRPNPLNPLSADEITTAVDIVKKSEHYQPGLRFTEVSVKAAERSGVELRLHRAEGRSATPGQYRGAGRQARDRSAGRSRQQGTEVLETD
jgi:primary-amine oxidase